MMVMIFEFSVPEDQMEDYLRESAALRPRLADIGGFVSVERFASETKPGRFVAIGYFTDEAAVKAWRNAPAHRRAQMLGREGLFDGYRLVMAQVVRDYAHDRQGEAPEDNRNAHALGGKCNVRP